MNTDSSGSGRVDDIKGHPQGELRGQTKLVKITEDMRTYATVYRAEARRRRKQGISENEALEKGLKEKSAEFVEKARKFTPKHNPVAAVADRGFCRSGGCLGRRFESLLAAST